MPTSHLAIDFGASSGRAMLAVLEGDPKSVRLEEVHRFEHAPLPTPTGPVWDFTGLWRELLAGLRRGASAAAEAGAPLASVGVDTWAVDWAFVDAAGRLLTVPSAYRDPANASAKERVLARFPRGVEALYRRNGIQPQPFNTLFQLEARRSACGESFDAMASCGTLLMLPDLLHLGLTGVGRCERTNASSTAMLDPDTGEWDRALLESAALPVDPLPPLVDPGTRLGSLLPAIAREAGIDHEVSVIAPATHDTASAVAAAPAKGEGWAYLSSGTWSLLGVEVAAPITTPEALAVPFTNELGVGNRTRFLRNIAGLWLVQELRRDLARRGEAYDYPELAELAESSTPLRTLIDPNHAELAEPGDAIGKLGRLARMNGEPEPSTAGELARCCLDSLSLCYAETIDLAQSVASVEVERIHVIGGGANHRLLNQLTADATGRAVMAGPAEATATGNALVQAMGLGLVDDLAELRAIVARSFPVERFTPGALDADWGAARARYARIVDRPAAGVSS